VKRVYFDKNGEGIQGKAHRLPIVFVVICSNKFKKTWNLKLV